MKRRLCFITAIILVGVGVADATVRSANTISHNTQSVIRTPTTKTTGRTIQTPTRQTSTTKTNTSRSATIQRSAIKSTTNARTAIKSTPSRSAVVRAATTSTIGTNTFDSGYNTCHDAYFTCMDQFCANQNDTYRRCVCSSRLQEIQKRQNILSDTSDSLQDFKDLNIDVIPKTSAEVKAMLTATSGEYAASKAKDKSNSAKTLSGISNILAKAKSDSLSTSGTLDIGGNINEIWATTDLTSGINLTNLSGEQLYNAVHAQCRDFVSDKCENKSTLNMVVSAYGMYIENDCALISSSLDKKKNEANTAIRETEREMNYARLDNYNAHNSSSINDCIANVRSDITQDAACGKDFVHCMDVTGLYLNKTTGEPIYTPNFYNLGRQISLYGDVLTNQQNRLVVAELNSKRAFAKNSLDSCRDLSDDVWDEFMRQAITEIYQAQQDRIRQVKNECLDVVNKCYDEQNASLKDFSNTDERLLLGSRLELSEEMCSEKLNTCSNLYGGGEQGMSELLSAMQTITDQKIELQCLANLQNYVQHLCAVPSIDTVHKYPYGCRTYAPGTYTDAIKPGCLQFVLRDLLTPNTNEDQPDYQYKYDTCKRQYTECNDKYYRKDNYCYKCPSECPNTCMWDERQNKAICINTDSCSADYSNSMYQKLVRYGLQVCVRPSIYKVTFDDFNFPEPVLQDINTVITNIATDMSTELGKECERLNGEWVPTPFNENSTDKISELFYSETSANTKWGYCKTKTGTNTETDNNK
ncbi:MAG: hypothetical protein MJ170_01330 [Alphaproteobacteria bacterium]|nr:hypothetical protein [Alphaproteobacteria bacterium]